MNVERFHQNPMTWLSGGLLVALIALLGPNSERVRESAATDAVPIDSSTTFPAVEGAVSLGSSMWDDPFIHIRNTQLSKESQKTSSQIKRLIKNKLGKEGRILHLVVPVDSGFTEENTERRRRRRHAVELAIANHGFELSFPDRMTYRFLNYQFYFTERPSAKPGADTSMIRRPRHCFLPTKLYRHANRKDFLLITWIQDSYLGSRPLETLRQAITPILDSSLHERASFCLLGPSSSDTLRRLVTDASRVKDNEAGAQEDEIRAFFRTFNLGSVICNIVCTATNSSVGLEDGQTSIALGEEVSLKLFHTIGSDVCLRKALVHELGMRGVLSERQSSTEMVLFAEQSSLSYINELRTGFANPGENKTPVVIPYLKGIAAEPTAGGSGVGESLTGSPSVQDYIDRSMSELNSLSTRRGINPRHVRCVGIIGSEWADKNLILERAREVFPVATFFTTELDARYNMPGVVGHARNLVVASHYGLMINGSDSVFKRINNIPSFRDGYQTSAFVGVSVVCYAFGKDKLTAKELEPGPHSQDLFDLVGRSSRSATDSPAFLKPLIFEIGSHGAVQLSSTEASGDLPLRQPPVVGSALGHIPWVVITIVCACGAVLCLNFLARFSGDLTKFRKEFVFRLMSSVKAFWTFVKGDDSGTGSSDGWAALVGSLIVVGVGILMIVAEMFPPVEPVSFTNGVSLWPSIWGLTLVIVFSLPKLMEAKPDAAKQRHFDREGEQVGRPELLASVKLAATVTVMFYLVSYIESGVIQPPARVEYVRWIALFVLLVATLCLLVVTFSSLLFSLYARGVMGQLTVKLADRALKSHHLGQIVDDVRWTMQTSIDASRNLMRPAILSCLLFVARWEGWDDWGLDRTWYILLATPMCISFIAAIVVRSAANQYRDKAIEVIGKERYRLVAEACDNGEPEDIDGVEIRLLVESQEEISRLDSGPYGPLSQDYLLGAGVLVLTIFLTGPASVFFNQVMAIAP